MSFVIFVSRYNILSIHFMTVTSLKKLVDIVTVDQGGTSEHLLTSTIVTVIEVRTDLFNCADEISKQIGRAHV